MSATSKSVWTRRRIVVAASIAGIAAGTVAAAVGVEATSNPAPGPSVPGTYVAGTAAGPGLSTDAAATKTQLALGGLVSRVSIVTDSDGLPSVQTVLSANAGPPGQGGNVRAVWFGTLAQGAVADQIRTTQSSLLGVISKESQVVQPSANGGSPIVKMLGNGNVAGGGVYVSPSDNDLRARVAGVAQKFGLTVNSSDILHPLGTALDVSFTVPDGDPSWTLDALRSALVGEPIGLEGVLITLKAPDGSPLLVAGVAYRAGAGGLWFAPGQDSRFGAGHGSMPVAGAASGGNSIG